MFLICSYFLAINSLLSSRNEASETSDDLWMWRPETNDRHRWRVCWRLTEQSCRRTAKEVGYYRMIRLQRRASRTTAKEILQNPPSNSPSHFIKSNYTAKIQSQWLDDTVMRSILATVCLNISQCLRADCSCLRKMVVCWQRQALDE